jgi:hypothetical protein
MGTDTTFAVTISKVIRAYDFCGLFRFGPKVFVTIKVSCDMRGKVFHVVTMGPQIDAEKMFPNDLLKARTEVLAKLDTHNRYTSRISKALTLTPLPVKNGPEPRPMTTEFREHKIKRRSIRGVEFVPPPSLIPKTLEPPPPPPKPYQKMKTQEYIETDEKVFGDTSKIYGRKTH